ncbi:hypothetical protein L1987_81576 [Smallanthus sonchifolius]|uniref:Uncharacterized protein n=1 Tax=Smallanthus sonchifolius TaxID=185202 RepID=A0ACB8YRX5_9ASTR|nr:hypothetical protein L1987_81576 [Smallanthus sonchifolius]
MAGSSSYGVSSNEVSVVKIIPTTRNPAIWSNYDLCELSNGLERARCKKCGGFFKKESNSTLKTHLESVFSLSGRVLSIRRTRLTPAAMEMCICLKDHLDAIDRRQDRASLEEEIEVEELIHESEVNQGLASPLTNEELAEDDRLRGSTSNSENDG